MLKKNRHSLAHGIWQSYMFGCFFLFVLCICDCDSLCTYCTKKKGMSPYVRLFALHTLEPSESLKWKTWWSFKQKYNGSWGWTVLTHRFVGSCSIEKASCSQGNKKTTRNFAFLQQKNLTSPHVWHVDVDSFLTWMGLDNPQAAIPYVRRTCEQTRKAILLRKAGA